MNKYDTALKYSEIAASIWRSGFIKDKNKVRQKAKEDMRRLIAYDISSNLIDLEAKQRFLDYCQLN